METIEEARACAKSVRGSYDTVCLTSIVGSAPGALLHSSSRFPRLGIAQTEVSAQMGTPAKLNTIPGWRVNIVGAKRRRLSDGRASVQLRHQQIRRAADAASEKRGAGKGRHVLSQPQHVVIRSASSAPNRSVPKHHSAGRSHANCPTAAKLVSFSYDILAGDLLVCDRGSHPGSVRSAAAVRAGERGCWEPSGN